jgi:hypothetical protein
MLEVRIDGHLYATMTEPGLAQDFFHQFVRHDDPVSPMAKIAFTSGFPALLNKNQAKVEPVTRPPPTALPAIEVMPSSSSKLDPQSVSQAQSQYRSHLDDSRSRDGAGKRRGTPTAPGGVDHEVHYLHPTVTGAGTGEPDLAWLRLKLKEAFKSKVYSLGNKAKILWKRFTRDEEDDDEVYPSTAEARKAYFAKWRARDDTLLVHRRVHRLRDEAIASAFILSYAALLVVLSLPPAMIRRTVKAAAIVRGKLKDKIANIHRAVSASHPLTLTSSYRSLEVLQEALQ